ncbi:hypothetical protein FKM82_018229 [Ascaphus truei]
MCNRRILFVLVTSFAGHDLGKVVSMVEVSCGSLPLYVGGYRVGACHNVSHHSAHMTSQTGASDRRGNEEATVYRVSMLHFPLMKALSVRPKRWHVNME